MWHSLIASSAQQGEAISTYEYDALSRRTVLNYANNTQTTYQYDNLNRLLNLANKTNNNENISTFAYTYDKVGNRLTRDEGRGTNAVVRTNYTYDAIYQLTQAANPPEQAITYVYDKLGNRVTAEGKTYTSNNLNQYTKVNNEAYGHDDKGNLTNDGTWTYGYDYENRLISADKTDVNATYKYDAFGRRIEKNVNGTITRFLYDSDQIIGEYDSSGELLRKYIYGLGIDEPIQLTSYTPQATSYCYHFDGLGSVTEITDSSGSLVEKYEYDAYGKTTIKGTSNNILSQSSIGNLYGFTGRELDVEIGLYYYRQRYYSPQNGRFLQTDPLGIDDENTYTYCDSVGKPIAGTDINLYEYAHNNPINFIDPYGLWYIDINISGGYVGGGTAGIIIGPEGIYPYEGPIATSPGIAGAIMWSPDNPSIGWNVFIQGVGIVAGQGGYSFNTKSTFKEIGIGGVYPTIGGISAGGYYVHDPWRWPWKRDKKKGKKC